MKIKKELQKANEKINAQILEEGKDVYDKLIAENEFTDDKNEKVKITSSNNFWNKKLVWICSMCSVLIIVLTLSIVLPLIIKNNAPIQYLEDNQKFVNESIVDVNLDLENFKINDNDFNAVCKKSFDGISGDKLYYQINLFSKNNQVNGKIDIITNKDYIYKERYNGDKILGEYKGYALIYTVKNDKSKMLPINNFFGCVKINDVKVYFEFSGFSEVFTTPTPFLDQVLIIK